MSSSKHLEWDEELTEYFVGLVSTHRAYVKDAGVKMKDKWATIARLIANKTSKPILSDDAMDKHWKKIKNSFLKQFNISTSLTTDEIIDQLDDLSDIENNSCQSLIRDLIIKSLKEENMKKVEKQEKEKKSQDLEKSSNKVLMNAGNDQLESPEEEISPTTSSSKPMKGSGKRPSKGIMSEDPFDKFLIDLTKPSPEEQKLQQLAIEEKTLAIANAQIALKERQLSLRRQEIQIEREEEELRALKRKKNEG